MSETETPPPLIPLTAAPAELAVRKESWRKGVHEFVAPAGVVARLDYQAWTGAARADTAEGTWGFSRVKGLTSARVEITQGDGGPEVAVMDKKTWTRGGSIELGGRTYELGAKGLLKATWSWTLDESTLVEVDLGAVLGKDKGVARITDAGRADPNVSLLVLLALHVSISNDNVGAVAAAAG